MPYKQKSVCWLSGLINVSNNTPRKIMYIPVISYYLITSVLLSINRIISVIKRADMLQIVIFSQEIDNHLQISLCISKVAYLRHDKLLRNTGLSPNKSLSKSSPAKVNQNSRPTGIILKPPFKPKNKKKLANNPFNPKFLETYTPCFPRRRPARTNSHNFKKLTQRGPDQKAAMLIPPPLCRARMLFLIDNTIRGCSSSSSGSTADESNATLSALLSLRKLLLARFHIARWAFLTNSLSLFFFIHAHLFLLFASEKRVLKTRLLMREGKLTLGLAYEKGGYFFVSSAVALRSRSSSLRCSKAGFLT